MRRTTDYEDLLNHCIKPEWPVPPRVKALVTTRYGGISLPPFDGLNLGDHVHDDPQSVIENRSRLQHLLPSAPLWLNQVHGTHVCNAKDWDEGIDADGTFAIEQKATKSSPVCCVMTADCLPVLMCNAQGTQVAAVHAGWRGLLNGVLASAVQSFQLTKSTDLTVWLGPAIGPQAFEVGQEVKDAFCRKQPESEIAFASAKQPGKYLADIYQLARIALVHSGIASDKIFGGGFCTFTSEDQFYSYRRDGMTGRMASCIWLEGEQK